MGFVAGDKIYRLVNTKDAVKRLHDARVSEGLSLEAAGALVGLRQPQLSRIESGVQEFFTGGVREKVEKLASVLNVKSLKFSESDWRQMRRGPTTKNNGVDEINDVIASTVPAPVQPSAPATDPLAAIAATIHVYRLGALDAQKALDTIINVVQGR